MAPFNVTDYRENEQKERSRRASQWMPTKSYSLKGAIPSQAQITGTFILFINYRNKIYHIYCTLYLSILKFMCLQIGEQQYFRFNLQVFQQIINKQNNQKKSQLFDCIKTALHHYVYVKLFNVYPYNMRKRNEQYKYLESILPRQSLKVTLSLQFYTCNV